MFLQRKKSLLKSGFLEGFTDRHSHLLPGVDDGFRTMEETLDALEYMESAGVSEIWLTPHIMEDIPNTTADLRNKSTWRNGIYLRLTQSVDEWYAADGEVEILLLPYRAGGPQESYTMDFEKR